MLIPQGGAPVVGTTWNPLDKSSDITLSSGNLVATMTGVSANANVRATVGKSSGKWHYEIVVNTIGGHGNYPNFGVANSVAGLGVDLGSDTNSIEYQEDGRIYYGGGFIGTADSFSTGVVLAIELDADAKNFYVRKNGGARNGPFSITSMFPGPIFPAAGFADNSSQLTANFAGPFVITPTAGYSAWG